MPGLLVALIAEGEETVEDFGESVAIDTGLVAAAQAVTMRWRAKAPLCVGRSTQHAESRGLQIGRARPIRSLPPRWQVAGRIMVASSIESFGTRDILHRATNRKKNPSVAVPGDAHAPGNIRKSKVARSPHADVRGNRIRFYEWPPSQHGDVSHWMFGQQNCEADQEEDGLWQAFFTAAPARRRVFEPSSKRRKRAAGPVPPATA